MKKCPFCAEEIQDEAIKCRYCSEFLDGYTPPDKTKKSVGFLQKVPWFIGFLILGPFVIPLVWANKKYSKNKKIIVTIVIVALTVFLIMVVIWAVKSILGYYRQLSDLFTGSLF